MTEFGDRRALAEALRHELGLGESIGERRAAGKNGLADLGHLQRAGSPLEQAHPEPLFELAQAPTEGRGTEAQLARGGDHAPFAHDRHETKDVVGRSE